LLIHIKEPLLSLPLDLGFNIMQLCLLLLFDCSEFASIFLILGFFLLLEMFCFLLEACPPLSSSFECCTKEFILLLFFSLDEGVNTSKFSLNLTKEDLAVFTCHLVVRHLLLELFHGSLAQTIALVELSSKDGFLSLFAAFFPLLCKLLLLLLAPGDKPLTFIILLVVISYWLFAFPLGILFHTRVPISNS